MVVDMCMVDMDQAAHTWIHGGIGTYDPDAPVAPVNILDQLVAAPCMILAWMQIQMPSQAKTRYKIPRQKEILMKLKDSDSDEEDNKSQVKIPPPIFKGLPGGTT